MKEVNTLIWNFIWDNKTNRIERNVCCLEKNKGGIGMWNLDMFIKTKQINTIYKLINSPDETWNIIGKWWLKKLDNVYCDSYFLCKCSNIEGLNINFLPDFYQKAIRAWSQFVGNFQSDSHEDLLNQNLFGNKNILRGQKPIFHKSFAQSGIKQIKDVICENLQTLKPDIEIYDKLIDKRNWIAEWSIIKSSVKDITSMDNQENALKFKMINMEFINTKGKKLEKIKVTHVKHTMLLEKKPNVQLKWNLEYEKDFNWNLLWSNLHKCPTSNKIKYFQWKCMHNIIYTESLLSKMRLSNGKCHFCTTETETLDHLFFFCVKSHVFMYKIFTFMWDTLPESNIISFEFSACNVMLGFNVKDDYIVDMCNLILFTAKWILWKERNLIKYQQKVCSITQLFALFKNILAENLWYSMICEKKLYRKNQMKLYLTNIANN